MSLGRATIHLPGGDGEPDLAPGDLVEIASDHPFVAGGYVVIEKENLEELTVAQLEPRAKALGVAGTGSMRRDELIKAILDAESDEAFAAPDPDAEQPAGDAAPAS